MSVCLTLKVKRAKKKKLVQFTHEIMYSVDLVWNKNKNKKDTLFTFIKINYKLIKIV